MAEVADEVEQAVGKRLRAREAVEGLNVGEAAEQELAAVARSVAPGIRSLLLPEVAAAAVAVTAAAAARPAQAARVERRTWPASESKKLKIAGQSALVVPRRCARSSFRPTVA